MANEAYRNDPYFIPVPATTVPSGGAATPVDVIMPNDAPFTMTHLSGWFTVPSGEVSQLGVKIEVVGSPRAITEGYVEACTILAPGHLVAGQAAVFTAPIPLKYNFPVNATVKVTLVNRSTSASVTCGLTMIGHKKWKL